MPIYSNIGTRIRQEEALTGRRAAPAYLRALYEADLEAQYRQQGEMARMGLMNRELALREKAAKNEASAARMSGLLQVAETGIKGYGTYRYLNPKTAAETATTAATQLPSYVPGLLEVEAWKPLSLPFAAKPTLTGVPALTPLSETALTTTPTVPVVAPSLLSTAGWAGGIGAGVGLGAKALGANKELSTAAGAASGAAYGFIVGGPVGGVVGLIAGVLPNLFGGKEKVICTELYRQGFISKKIHLLDEAYAKVYIDKYTLKGYHLWAKPVVKLMRKSRIFTYMVYPFGKAWAYEMAHRVNPKVKGSILGKVLHGLGVPVCRFIGKGMNSRGKGFKKAKLAL